MKSVFGSKEELMSSGFIKFVAELKQTEGIEDTIIYGIVYDKNLNFLFEFADKARKNSLEYPCEELEKKLRKVSEERGLIWGWKESSIAELGLARPLLSWILRVCSNVYCVFCHRRDKEAHAKSISKGLWSGKTSMEWCRNSIKEQEEVIEEFLRKFKIPRLDIYFEDFFTTPEQEVRKIADFLEVPYTSEAKDFIKLDMKHF